MTKFLVNLKRSETPFWRERQINIAHELGVRIDLHGNPIMMWVFADQFGQRAMAVHPQVLDFVVASNQIPESQR